MVSPTAASLSVPGDSVGGQHYVTLKKWCKITVVKRLQIMIDEDLDQVLERMALQQRTSKAALIRGFVRERVTTLPPIEHDAVSSMIGVDDFAPAPVDDVVYR